MRFIALPTLRAFLLTSALVSLCSAQQQLSFPTQDGGVVFADLYGKGDRGLVLAHGGPFTKESWRKQALILQDAGFRVLAIDFRGYGQSHGGSLQVKNDDGYRFDVLAAVRYLHKIGAKSVSVIGASFGGDAAAQASIESQPGEIDRLVMLAAYTGEPRKIKGRKLFIVARDDANSDGPRLPDIQANYDKATQPKELIIVDGSAHAQYLFDTNQGDRVMREILRFLTAP